MIVPLAVMLNFTIKILLTEYLEHPILSSNLKQPLSIHLELQLIVMEKNLFENLVSFSCYLGYCRRLIQLIRTMFCRLALINRLLPATNNQPFQRAFAFGVSHREGSGNK